MSKPDTFVRWTHPTWDTYLVTEASDTETAKGYLGKQDDPALLQSEPEYITRSQFESLPDFEG